MLPRILVMGAGITGSCVALELTRRGHDVTLVDQAHQPMTAASLHNEGKLHLGFVYASDPRHATHAVMLEGSLSFAPILASLTGATCRDLGPSSPFYYAVPHDSQISGRHP